MKILIVRDSGMVSNVAILGHYDEQINRLEDILKKIQEDTSFVEEMTVSIVKQDEVENILSLSGGINTVVFYITKSMLPRAKEIAQKFPAARILLGTASLPYGEVVIFSKYNLTAEVISTLTRE